MYNYCELDKKILHIARYEYEYFFKKPNVVGVGLGCKIVNGFYTGEKCITVFVVKKILINKLSLRELIPNIYHDIVTDVVETGVIRANSFTDRIRPVVGGYSIGTETSLSTATMGCLVTDKHYYYILGSSHVLAYGKIVTLGSKIIQPGRSDRGKVDKDTIATLSKYITIKYKKKFSTPVNYVDCAMGKVLDKSNVSSDIAIIGKIKGITDPRIHEKVAKVGRSTELTRGVISNIGVSIEIDYDFGKALLVNQIITSKMSQIGDSGAILVDLNNYAVGLVTASGNNISIHNPIVPVLENLGVRLVMN